MVVTRRRTPHCTYCTRRPRDLTPRDRGRARSLEDLHAWLTDQIDQYRIEPDSGLGQAIAYLLRHWCTAAAGDAEP